MLMEERRGGTQLALRVLLGKLTQSQRLRQSCCEVGASVPSVSKRLNTSRYQREAWRRHTGPYIFVTVTSRAGEYVNEDKQRQRGFQEQACLSYVTGARAQPSWNVIWHHVKKCHNAHCHRAMRLKDPQPGTKRWERKAGLLRGSTEHSQHKGAQSGF